MIIKKYKVVRLLKRILLVIVVCVVIYILTNILNYFIPKTEKIELTDKDERTIQYNKPAFGNVDTTDEQITKFSKLIDDYFNYCNNNEYQKAYDLVDDEAKQKFYPTIEEFKAYIDNEFNKFKLYEYKNIVNIDKYYAYTFILYNDVMTYGSKDNNERKEYTIIISDNENGLKLNMNSFIGMDSINYSTEVNGINLEIISKEIYYGRTIFNVKMKNTTEDLFVYKVNDVNYYTKGESSIYDHNLKGVPLNLEYRYIQPNMEKEYTFVFDKLFAEVYSDYKFSIKDSYLLNMNQNNDIVSGKLTVNEIETLYKSKFDIQIGL